MTFPDWSNSPLWNAAGVTMLHYLWIGAVVAVLSLIARRVSAAWGARVRYPLALAFLAVLAALPLGIFTWSLQHSPLQIAAVETPRDIEALSPSLPPAAGGSEDVSPETGFLALPDNDASNAFVESSDGSQFDSAADAPLAKVEVDDAIADGPIDDNVAVPASATFLVAWLPWLWIFGTPATLLLLATGCVGASRLRRIAQPLTGEVAELCRALAEKLDVARPVAVAVCDRVAAPILVGILRPVILLPPALLANWSTSEVELVLLHELAHVRRWDNLVNLLQRLVEALLFYQPAVWVVSDWVRCEREHACDELVVRHTGRTRDYAALLARLAAAQAGKSFLFDGLVSSSMARSHVAARIRYLIFREYEPMRISARFWTIAGVVLLALLGVLGWQSLEPRGTVLAQGESRVAAGNKEAVEEAPPASPAIAKELLHYDGKSFAQWNAEWRTELKPERRQEAIAAFLAFAKNGFGPESAESIVEVMRNYNTASIDNSPEGRLKSAALTAFRELPLADTLPVMQRELRDGATQGKVFVLMVLDRYSSVPQARSIALAALGDKQPLVRILGLHCLDNVSTDPKQITEVLLKAMQDQDVDIRAAALETGGRLDLRAEPFMAVYRAALQAEQPEVVEAALHVLASRPREGMSGMPGGGMDSGGFGGGFDDLSGDMGFDSGYGESGVMGEIGTYVPEILTALKHPNDHVWKTAGNSVYALGPAAKEAVPALIEMACQGHAREQPRARTVLGLLAKYEPLKQPIAQQISEVLKSGQREQLLPTLKLLYEVQRHSGGAVLPVLPTIKDLQEDDDEAVREYAELIERRHHLQSAPRR